MSKFPEQCEHHYCRCMRAAELASMGKTLEAIQVHGEKVLCRYLFDGTITAEDQKEMPVTFVF